MEGERAWSFASPAFVHSVERAQPLAGATYLPEGRRKRRRRGRKQQGRKRHKAAGGSGVSEAVAPLLPAFSRLAPATPPDPTQLAPLRCSLAHPAVLNLFAQQCWPAAGPAALLPCSMGAEARSARPAAWWNRMLPSLSLLHPPLTAQQQVAAAAAGSAGDDIGLPRALPLPQHNVLVGHEDDWLEVPAAVLPLWQATPLAPFAGPKALLHYLLCPQPLLAAANQLVRDVGSVYETCNLGVHIPASDEEVLDFPLPSGLGTGVQGAETEQHLTAAYMAGLRVACEQLQRQLLLDPPPELEQMRAASLDSSAEPAVLVYLACPLEAPADQLTALLEAACCLAPCTPLGAASDVGVGLGLLPPAGSSANLARSSLHASQLAPCEPQQPDRPAIATPAADKSRGPGSSPLPDEQAEEGERTAGGAEQQRLQRQAEQGEGRQRQYHGAAQVLHDQQHGDFTQLPARQVQRPEGSHPVNLVLQLLTPRALADLDGTAARCTAFALYSKTRHVPTDSRVEQMVATAQPAQAPPAALPFCSQPLMVLSSAAAVEAVTGGRQQQVHLGEQQEQPEERQQRQQQQAGLEPPSVPAQPAVPLPSSLGAEQHEDGECMDAVEQQGAAQQVTEQQASCGQVKAGGRGGEAALPRRTLHCFYVLPPPGCPFLPLAMADSCGELLHAELLDISAAHMAGIGLGLAGSSTGGPHAAAPAMVMSSSTSLVCQLVLQRCLELLGLLRAASNPPGVLHSLAIAAAGMQQAELEAWRQLVGDDAPTAPGLDGGVKLAVLNLHALPPARFAGPDPPSGCKLVLERGTDGRVEPQARILWLPAADSTCSLLPREHDVVRSLQVALVCHGATVASEPAQQPAERLHQGGQQSAESAQERSAEDSLCSLAGELHGLAWLHAAFQGACLHAVAGGGQPAAADAHLPLHAALASKLHALLTAAAPRLSML